MNYNYHHSSLNNNISSPKAFQSTYSGNNNVAQSIQYTPMYRSLREQHIGQLNSYLQDKNTIHRLPQGYQIYPQTSSVYPTRSSQSPLGSDHQLQRNDKIANVPNQLVQSVNQNFRYGEQQQMESNNSQFNVQTPIKQIQRENALYRSWSPLFVKEKIENAVRKTITPQKTKEREYSLNNNKSNQQPDFARIVSNDTQKIIQKWNSPNQFGITPIQNTQFYEQIRRSNNFTKQSSPINIVDPPFETVSSLESNSKANHQQLLYDKPDIMIEDPKAYNSHVQQSLVQNKGQNVLQFSQTPPSTANNYFSQTQYPTNQLNSQTEMRVGIGYSAHKLNKKKKLILAGVDIPSQKGLDGPFNGDTLVIAIIESLSGATKQEEMIKLINQSNQKQKQEKTSIEILKEAQLLLEKDQIKILNIDSIIMTDGINLTEYVSQMEKSLSQALKVLPNKISVKISNKDTLGVGGLDSSVASKVICMISQPVNIYKFEQSTLVASSLFEKKPEAPKEVKLQGGPTQQKESFKLSKILFRDDSKQVNQRKTTTSTSKTVHGKDDKIENHTLTSLKQNSNLTIGQKINNAKLKLKSIQPIKVYASVIIFLLIILFYTLFIK